MTRDELEMKTKPELMAEGEERGLKMTPAMSKGDMIDKLLGGNEGKKREDPLPAEGRFSHLDGSPVPAMQMYNVTILATEQEKGDVFLGVNGHGYQIQRGVEVTLPQPYVEVLKNSVIDTFTKDSETGKVQRLQIQRYPFSAVPA